MAEQAFQQNPDAEPAPDAPKREYPKNPPPHGNFNISVPGNVIHLATSHKAHAFFITFDKNPSEGLPKGEKHPVIHLLREYGARWAAAPDGSMGWKLGWPIPEGQQFSPYPHAMHESLKAFITETLAPAMGKSVEQGVSR